MERRAHDELFVVSRYWTPQHLDVTNVPLTYARPKAPWLDEFRRLRRRLSSDTYERTVRRGLHTHAVVDVAEVPVLPPLPAPADVAEHRTDFRPFFGEVRALVERRFAR